MSTHPTVFRELEERPGKRLGEFDKLCSAIIDPAFNKSEAVGRFVCSRRLSFCSVATSLESYDNAETIFSYLYHVPVLAYSIRVSQIVLSSTVIPYTRCR